MSWLVKLEGELDTAVFFAFFVKLVLAIAATEMEMGQITHFSSDVKSGIWFDLRQINLSEKIPNLDGISRIPPFEYA